MKSLIEVRQAYEENYRKMTELIQKMGGDDCIKQHRQRQSTLYRKLRQLQRHEHYLDALENRFLQNQATLH